MKNRLLALVSALFIPYVAVRFPREVGTYVRYTWEVLVTGKRWPVLGSAEEPKPR